MTPAVQKLSIWFSCKLLGQENIGIMVWGGFSPKKTQMKRQCVYNSTYLFTGVSSCVQQIQDFFIVQLKKNTDILP